MLVPLLGTTEVLVALGERSRSLTLHGGELSFPGGRFDPRTDADLRATALREAEEEMGIDPSRVEVVAELTPISTISTHFLIASFVGIVSEAVELSPARAEFERILAVPLHRLLERGVYHEEIWPRPAASGGERAVNFFTLDEWNVVWGATATVLRELLDVLTRG